MEMQLCLLINDILRIMNKTEILTHDDCLEISINLKKYNLILDCISLINDYDVHYKNMTQDNNTYYS